MENRDSRRSFLEGVVFTLLVVVTLYSGYMIFRMLWSRYSSAPMDVNTKVEEILRVLDEHSINTYDKEDLVQEMYRGLLDGVGDPYTYYFDKEGLQSFMQQTEGTYAGIGAVVTIDPDDGMVTVVTPYEGSPSEAAGLQPGDKILRINGIDVSGLALTDVTSMTKGSPGSTVEATIMRDGDENGGQKTFDVLITRAKIDIPTVSSEMLDNGVGYIRIASFDRVTEKQYMDALSGLKNQGMTALILDLRNNPGGLLDVVCHITDTLVPEGTIVYTEDKKGEKTYTKSDKDTLNMPLAVLVNGNSASASEVLSGAVKDYGTGALVGTKTFGKGIVQNLFTLSDGSAVKVTIAKYYTPNGICIQGEGIVPDYVVELDESLAARVGVMTPEEDAQLAKAIEVVTK